jgi:hypothetical protein
MVEQDIIKWLGYREEEILEPKRHFFHFKRKKIKRYVDEHGTVCSVNFENDWNDLMLLVESIESKGYCFFITSQEIRVERDYINNPFLAPKVELTFRKERRDRTKKVGVYNICLQFIKNFNLISLNQNQNGIYV